MNLLPEWMDPQRAHAFYADALFLIPLLPFLGFLINALTRKGISRGASGGVACLAAALSFLWTLLSFSASAGGLADHVRLPDGSLCLVRDPAHPLHAVYGTWIEVGAFHCSFGLYMDQLSGLLALVVTGVGLLIHIYSMGYMGHDKAYARYFAYLNLFLFAMLVLILSDNLVLTFVGWEGVGLCSYLLIGFWYEDAAKASAGMKAFIFNRVGDLGFLLGIFTLLAVFGTVDYVAPPRQLGTYRAPVIEPRLMKPTGQGGDVAQETLLMPENPGLLDYAKGLSLLAAPKATRPLRFSTPDGRIDLSRNLATRIFPDWFTLGTAMTLACVLLFVGACGKSAQLPLYAWLPDAMAGPTPVSALIHAATMVTAGVYMAARLHPLYLMSPEAMHVMACVGGLTAIFAALCALTQTDIKKVLAYSTVSQLGYMFLGAGVGAFAFAIFHVVTHAFFKALLFLCSGSVIHAMSGEQDMRKMGGLRKQLPLTFITMFIGALALAGFPFFAGWWSKDAILAQVLARAHESHESIYYLLYVLAVVGAFCTAFYSFRLIGMTFFGTCRASAEVKQHIHESPPTMTTPLLVLAFLSAAGGVLWANSLPTFLNFPEPTQNANHPQVHHVNLVVTLVAAFGGILLALFLYAKNQKVPQPAQSKNVLVALSWNKFGVEAFYDKVVTTTFIILAEMLYLVVDVLIIDTLFVNGLGFATRATSGALRRMQSGVVNLYAAGILLGALAVLFFLLRG